jgi:predicted Zn-dependent protease
MNNWKLLTNFLVFLSLLSCASSPLERRQVVLYSEADMAQQGVQTYEGMLEEMPVSRNPRLTAYVQCVTDYIVEALEPEQRGGHQWEVALFENEQANAFALPGGKMGVFTGLLNVASNQDQLATVMAHEVGHVLARHSNERASQSTIANISRAVAQVAGASDTTLEVFDLTTEYGLFLPFNRTQESEADQIGIMLMASAGFDPQESINLWRNMSSLGGARPPELLSTHPSPNSRINNLRRLLPDAESAWAIASSNGVLPACRAPD